MLFLILQMTVQFQNKKRKRKIKDKEEVKKYFKKKKNGE
jgi:hypothetical protein